MKFSAALVIGLFFSLNATAAGLADAKMKKQWAEDIKESSVEADKSCGKKIPVAMDEPAFLAAAPAWMEANMSMSGQCKMSMDTLADMCKDDMTKKALVAKVKSVKCMPSKKDDEAIIDIKNGTLAITYGKTKHVPPVLKEYLEKNL